jgi:hypothetical protein
MSHARSHSFHFNLPQSVKAFEKQQKLEQQEQLQKEKKLQEEQIVQQLHDAKQLLLAEQHLQREDFSRREQLRLAQQQHSVISIENVSSSVLQENGGNSSVLPAQSQSISVKIEGTSYEETSLDGTRTGAATPQNDTASHKLDGFESEMALKDEEEALTHIPINEWNSRDDDGLDQFHLDDDVHRDLESMISSHGDSFLPQSEASLLQSYISHIAGSSDEDEDPPNIFEELVSAYDPNQFQLPERGESAAEPTKAQR